MTGDGPGGTSDVATLVDLLHRRAAQEPGRVAYVFLADGETPAGRLTYRDLDKGARAVGARLRNEVASGARALMLYPPGLDSVIAFFGCLYAGIVAVPSFPPRPNRASQRVQAIASDAEAAVVLTQGQLQETISGSFEGPDRTWIATDRIDSASARPWSGPRPDAEDLAYLQYTSGSTGTPKGVMVSHANLLANLEDLDRGWQHDRHSVMVNWLPVFHDLGLIYGILQPLYRGFPCYLLPPAAFLQRPRRWLEAITRYGASHSAAPNFAYDLCVGKIPPADRAGLDLGSWQMALNAAEPVREETQARFVDAFGDCGFRSSSFCPGYGLAEATLKVTAVRKAEQRQLCHVRSDALSQDRVVRSDRAGAETVTLVGCGRSEIDTKLAIVNPDNRMVCPADRIGEIWISGKTVPRGYWRRPDETRETFQAALSDGEGPFLRTGDLGFVAEGQLYVTGRLKDLIIVHGLNHYPQDIELTAERADPSLRPNAGAAFSVEVGGEERLVVVQEVERRHMRRLDGPAVIDGIRQAVADQHDLQAHAILLLKPGSIPKTSSGKIARRACRDRYLLEDFLPLAEWRVEPETPLTESEAPEAPVATASAADARSIRAWLVARFSRSLGVAPDEIDLDMPFARFGLDSLATVALAGDLESWLGFRVAPTLGYDYPTIERLSDHLARCLDPAAARTAGVSTQDERAEPIAIVGLACRFPQAENREAFWSVLRDGVDAIGDVPKDRWDSRRYFDERPGTPGKSVTCWGGFLEAVDRFDASFFGISPREADYMDPQQRLLLEVAWEALEHAGLAPDRLAGSDGGVFVGISISDYLHRLLVADPDSDAYLGTGNAFCIAANRLSYLLDLHGPSWAVDTACSSSLVAVHQACQSLERRDCNLALVGGVNLLLSPDLTIALSQARMLAPDGRCKTFDAAADGYVRSEGCGVVVLKRLSDALRDGDPIQAVVRGSAVNQDGRTNGLTAPNGPAQASVIRAALRRAGVSARQLDYIEAHGTGTALGDPIELGALGALLEEAGRAERACWIGSVKANIGHLEAAAGIAGLIKVVLAFQNGAIPPLQGFKSLNPNISLDSGPLRIPQKLEPWPQADRPGLAGVSSFGFGGTNAHVVLESAPAEAARAETPARPCHLLVLSAKSEAALRALAARYGAHLEGDQDPGDVCYTAHSGRSHFAYRAGFVGADGAELAARAAAFGAGELPAGVVTGEAGEAGKIGFLFTGQGSQYAGMGRELYETQAVFRDALDRCAAHLEAWLDRPLLSLLHPASGDAALLDQTGYTQPALFALEYGLSELWRSWGLEPSFVLGHSVGEYVAACVAGVFSLEDGLRLIAARGRLMQDLPPGGRMVAVQASEATVSAALAGGAVSIAAVNGPESVVISGAGPAVEKVAEVLSASGHRIRGLRVSHAFHSALMDPMLPAFARVAESVRYASPSIELIGNVSGTLAGEELARADYWVEQVRAPVRFSAGLSTLAARGCEVFLEVGPTATLLAMGRQLPDLGDRGLWLASLRPGRSDWRVLLESLGRYHVSGGAVDWRSFESGEARRKVALPSYPFERRRYWVGPSSGRVGGVQAGDAGDSEVLSIIKRGDRAELSALLGADAALTPELRQGLPDFVDLLLRRHAEQAAPHEDWLYELEWQACSRQVVPVEGGAGLWLIFSDRAGLGAKLAALLEARGHRVMLIDVGALDPGRASDFTRLFVELGGTPLARVLYLWGLDAEDDGDPMAQQRASCGGALHLVQALVGAGLRSPGLLWLVSRNAVSAGPDVSGLSLGQAPLRGLGKVIALEHPELWGGQVDLGPEAETGEAGALLSEVLDSAGEDQIALRGDLRYVARLRRQAAEPGTPPAIEAEGSYLITGGLGALGLSVAAWLVERGARHLVLVGRRAAPDAAAQARLSALEAAGAVLRYRSADVSDRTAMAAVLDEAAEAGHPVRGIVHAAGVTGFQALTSLDLVGFEAVLEAKVGGAWVLHELSRPLDLSFFVSFSSIASAWGSVGQAHYAAANQFLDSLSHHRRSRGLPSLSINWGPLEGGGMVTPDAAQRLERMGVQGLTAAQALQVLGQVLGDSRAQLIVAKVDWSRFKDLYEARGQRALLNDIEIDGGSEPPPASTKSTILAGFDDQPPDRRLALLSAHLERRIAEILGLDADEALPPELGFATMGLDSLMAVELKTRLAEDFACSLPATLAFDYPTLSELTAYLSGQVLGWTTEAPGGAAPRDSNVGQVHNSEEALAERLARLESLVGLD